MRSLGLGLGLETFAKFLRVSVSVSENLVSEKNYQFQKITGKKLSVSENLVLEKKSWFLVSVKILVPSFSVDYLTS